MPSYNNSKVKCPMPHQDAAVRAHNFDEVALGYTAEQAIEEASRCLGCKNMPCVSGCPVNIHIPEFIDRVKVGDFEGAYDVIRTGMDEVGDEIGWNNLGYIDSMCHAHRMNYPVLLTLGTGDVVCPPKTIRALYDVLDTDKMLFSMRGRGHGHQFEFIRHVLTYLELYA